MKKTYLLTLGLVGTLFLGCANKNTTVSKNIKPKQNFIYKAESKYLLYMPIKNNFGKDIVENIVIDKIKLVNRYRETSYYDRRSYKYVSKKKKLYNKAVELNTLKPIGYKKIAYKFNSVSDWGLGSMKKRGLKCNGFYTLKKYYSSKDVATNVTVGVLTFGLSTAIFGNVHGEQCVFNNNKFENFILNYLKNHNINRKILIDKYAKLVDQEHLKNKQLSSFINKIQQKYNIIKLKPLKEKYIDKIGFLSTKDHIHLNIKKNMDIPKKPDLKKIVSGSFPCTPMQECLNKFAFTSKKINFVTQSYINKLKERDKKKEFIKYSFNKNPHKYDNKNGKILYYNVTVNPQTDTAVYTIYRADFYDVIPSFSIKNSTIKVEELPNGKVKFTNLTNKFIDIDTLSIYFKDRIINIPVNLQLAPHGEKKLYVKGFADVVTELNNLHGRVDFKEFYTLSNITAKDKNKKITVGLAVKYKVAGSNKTNTLYNETKYPISKLIKNKI